MGWGTTGISVARSFLSVVHSYEQNSKDEKMSSQLPNIYLPPNVGP